MRCFLLSLLVVCCGCFGGKNGDTPAGEYAPNLSRGMAKVAVISASIDLDRPRFVRSGTAGTTTTDPEPEPETAVAVAPPETPAPVAPAEVAKAPEAAFDDPRPTINVVAPQWAEGSTAFLAAYDTWTADVLDPLPFQFKLVPAPDTLDLRTVKLPMFIWSVAGQEYVSQGWVDLPTFTATVQQVSPALCAPAPTPVTGKKKDKRDHGFNAPGTIDIPTLIPFVVADGLTFSRTADADLEVPVGYGAVIRVPKDMQITAHKAVNKAGDEYVQFSIDVGAPEILLPVLRRIWPVRIEGLTLANNRLTVILDGWKDYSIDLNW